MTHSYQLFCWLFINHPNVYTWWMKSSNQHAQTQEQRGTCIHALKTNGFDRSVLYLWQHTLTHTRLKTTPAIRVLTHKHTHTCYACISPLACAVCISHPQILLYTARCLLFVQERNSPLNFPNSAHTSGQLSIYARVNISCSEKPLNYPFETQVNALNNRTTLVALTLSSLAHNTDLLPDSQWDTHTHTTKIFPR